MAKNYTTGTEVDGNNRFTVDATSITVENLSLPDISYLYWDEGVDFFDGDYTHTHDINTYSTSSSGSYGFSWILANEVGDLTTIVAGNLGWHGIRTYTASGLFTIRLYEGTTGGSSYNDQYVHSGDTTYYLTCVRDESVGAFGTLYCYIYSDTERTILVDTLILTLHEKIDFRYVYGGCSFGAGGVEEFDGKWANLDIGGDVPPVAGLQKFAGIFGVGRIGVR
jgi:hypothetical protein